MKNHSAVENRIRSRVGTAVYAVVVASAVALLLPRAARAGEIVVPAVPGNLAVEAGNVPFLVGHAVGTQNYVCLPTSTGVAFALFTPEATLLGDDEEQVITHFFAPNPDEPNNNPALTAIGPIRAAWQHSHDGSTVWAQVQNGASSVDERFVARNSVAWLTLTKVGDERGFAGGDVLTKTTFVQRLNTHGGVAPATGCLSTADVGHLAFVPYTADYFFYRAK